MNPSLNEKNNLTRKKTFKESGVLPWTLVVLAAVLPGLWVCSLCLGSCGAVGSSSWLSGPCWVSVGLPACFGLDTLVSTAAWCSLYVLVLWGVWAPDLGGLIWSGDVLTAWSTTMHAVVFS